MCAFSKLSDWFLSWQRRQTKICCVLVVCMGIVVPAALAKTTSKKNVTAKPKSQQQMMDLLDKLEKSPVGNTGGRSRYPALQHMHHAGMPAQSLRRHVWQQGAPGANAGTSPPAFMRTLQQKMQTQGGQGTATAEPRFMRMLRQRMQGMNSGMPGAGGPGSAINSSGAPTPIQQPAMAQPQRGFFGAFRSPQPAATGASNKTQDLEKLMESQYGR